MEETAPLFSRVLHHLGPHLTEDGGLARGGIAEVLRRIGLHGRFLSRVVRGPYPVTELPAQRLDRHHRQGLQSGQPFLHGGNHAVDRFRPRNAAGLMGPVVTRAEGPGHEDPDATMTAPEFLRGKAQKTRGTRTRCHGPNVVNGDREYHADQGAVRAAHREHGDVGIMRSRGADHVLLVVAVPANHAVAEENAAIAPDGPLLGFRKEQLRTGRLLRARSIECPARLHGGGGHGIPHGVAPDLVGAAAEDVNRAGEMVRMGRAEQNVPRAAAAWLPRRPP